MYRNSPLFYASYSYDKDNTFFVIWTTTPWTLPGNMGIAIGPDFEYDMVEANSYKYIIAKETTVAIALPLAPQIGMRK